MPSEAKVFRIQIFQNIPVTLLAQVKSLYTGKLLVSTDIASITFTIFDLDSADPNAAVNSGSVTVAVALHTPKLDDRWTQDQVGFNFDHTLPAGAFPSGGRTYALQYLFTGPSDPSPSGTIVYHVGVLNARGQ